VLDSRVSRVVRTGLDIAVRSRACLAHLGRPARQTVFHARIARFAAIALAPMWQDAASV